MVFAKIGIRKLCRIFQDTKIFIVPLPEFSWKQYFKEENEMKKARSLLLALTMVFALAACTTTGERWPESQFRPKEGWWAVSLMHVGAWACLTPIHFIRPRSASHPSLLCKAVSPQKNAPLPDCGRGYFYGYCSPFFRQDIRRMGRVTGKSREITR